MHKQTPSFPEPETDRVLKYGVLQGSFQLRRVCATVGSSQLAREPQPLHAPAFLHLGPTGATYPAGGEVAGLSAQFIDLRFCDISTLFCLLELMLSFAEFGEVSVGLFVLKPKRPGRSGERAPVSELPVRARPGRCSRTTTSLTYGLLSLPLVRLDFHLELIHQVLQPQHVLPVLFALKARTQPVARGGGRVARGRATFLGQWLSPHVLEREPRAGFALCIEQACRAFFLLPGRLAP